MEEGRWRDEGGGGNGREDGRRMKSREVCVEKSGQKRKQLKEEHLSWALRLMMILFVAAGHEGV